MDQHPIPRQITTFEFKLIGFMTLKQFLYLVVFVPSGYIVFKIFPIPFLNFLLGFLTAGIGAALAFVPIQDKPLDQWIKNLWKRLNAPTQYTYGKNNPPFYLVQNLYFAADPHKVMAHIESKEKLAAYLAATNQRARPDTRKQDMQQLLRKPTGQINAKQASPVAAHAPAPQQPVATAPRSAPPAPSMPPAAPMQPPTAPVIAVPPPQGITAPMPPRQPSVQAVPAAPPAVMPVDTKHPHILGIVKNNKKIPLPGVLIYIKDQTGRPLRLLKTNPHGVFASYNPLPDGTYVVEVKDPKEGYFFDTMNIQVKGNTPVTFDVHSKEML